MSREVHVRIRESAGVKFPRATRPLVLRLDLGFLTWRSQRIRLAGVDAPPLTDEEGREAYEYVRDQLAKASWVMVKTHQ
jgi:endonuclease YncB( thermonuclease family)